MRVGPTSYPIAAALLFFGGATFGSDDVSAEQERFFERQIRPILSEHCIECHGATEQSGGLRLDSDSSLRAGGDSGPAIVPGRPQASRLIQAVRHSGDLKMPPEQRLTLAQIRALEQWVLQGAVWPKSELPLVDPRSRAAKKHWAFQPVRSVTPPAIPSEWIQNPIDAFVLDRLRKAGLQPSPPTDRRMLLRRATMSLTGLLPSAADVQRFSADQVADSFPKEVDRLLDSSAYGEQWARHWLDIARYSDSKGYVYAREERMWVHSWLFRDWVIQALNQDMPYDRFLLLQLAADQIPDRRVEDMAAMGFLTLGRRFLGVTRDIIDDRIDAITRGTMGLTVACARCHDHKYDPIPTTDYYAFYGVLDSCEERRVELPGERVAADDWQKEYRKRQSAFKERYDQERKLSSERCRDMLQAYLQSQTELETIPAQGFDQILHNDDLVPDFVRRWDEYLRRAKRIQHPVFRHWHALFALSAADFTEKAPAVIRDLHGLPAGEVNPLVSQAFSAQTVHSHSDVVRVYSDLLAGVRDEWRTHRSSPSAESPASTTFLDPAAEQVRGVLYGADSPCEIPAERLVHTETLFSTKTCQELWKLQKEIDVWINTSPHQQRTALVLQDRPKPLEPRVFRRGNPKTPGKDVSRAFLTLFEKGDPEAFQEGSGRRELAAKIASADNPLTARVIVNRVWAWHFGTGLVTTPSDFGLRAEPPSHPDLLDWLTKEFVAHGWSLKHLHRWILTSATWQQSSAWPSDANLRSTATQVDPGNRLLWRMPIHRLTFEEYRDCILQVSGELDRRTGGRAEPLFAETPFLRRTIYGQIDRQFFPTTLRVFDVANPDIHIAQRSQTTIPQQALFYMNHPLVLDRARYLAAKTEQDSPGAQVEHQRKRAGQIFQTIFQRSPTTDELDEALLLVSAAVQSPTGSEQSDSETLPLKPWEQLAWVLLCSNEFLFVD